MHKLNINISLLINRNEYGLQLIFLFVFLSTEKEQLAAKNVVHLNKFAHFPLNALKSQLNNHLSHRMICSNGVYEFIELSTQRRGARKRERERKGYHIIVN